MAKKESKKYVFLKDVKQGFSVKKGDVLQGQEKPGYVVFFKSNPNTNPNARVAPLTIKIPFSEIGKTIKVVDASIPPASTGGTTGGNTTTESKSLFTTKNIVIGVSILAIAYFGYTKFIKKGK